jgi:UDP-N-acetylmuramate dehydrogenase
MSDDCGLAAARTILRDAVATRLRENFALAPLTSFRLGGPAALYLEAESDADLEVAGRAISASGIPHVVIGKGSNLLVSDKGFEGLVLRLGRGFRWVARDGARLTAGAAMPLPALAGVALSHALAGLEFGVAIPASLGGCVRMNAGAHGHSLDEAVERVEIYLLGEGAKGWIGADEAGFAYRSSALPDATVVTAADLRLSPGNPGEIRTHMDEAREWRRATQPLAEPNCGSVFKNPPGDHAARLVEAAGAKGLSVGGARVSEKHSNFVVASPGTTAEDVYHLITMVRERVRERFGTELEMEVHLVGRFPER